MQHAACAIRQATFNIQRHVNRYNVTIVCVVRGAKNAAALAEHSVPAGHIVRSDAPSFRRAAHDMRHARMCACVRTVCGVWHDACGIRRAACGTLISAHMVHECLPYACTHTPCMRACAPQMQHALRMHAACVLHVCCVRVGERPPRSMVHMHATHRHATCSSHVAASMLHDACCMMHVACCMWHVACCMWHVACCMWRHECNVHTTYRHHEPHILLSIYRSMPMANAEDPCRSEGYLKRSLTDTFPMLPSGSVSVSAVAVVTPRKVVKNEYVQRAASLSLA